jgi:hypothetical protein
MLLDDNNIPNGYYIVKTDKFDINKLKEIKYDYAYVKITRKAIKVDYFVGKDYLDKVVEVYRNRIHEVDRLSLLPFLYT